MIRPAQVEDAPIIAHHRVSMFRDMGSLVDDAIPSLQQASLDALIPLLRSGAYLGWLAVLAQDPATIIGGGGVHLLERLPRISVDKRAIRPAGLPMIVNVYTEPAWRGKGVARRVMDEIIRWAEDNGEEMLFLHASSYGRRLYEQLGFVPTNEMKRAVQTNREDGHEKL